MKSYISVNGQREPLYLYAVEGDKENTTTWVTIDVYVLDDDGHLTVDGVKACYLDDELVPLSVDKVTKFFRATASLDLTKLKHQVKVELVSGAITTFDIEVKDISEQENIKVSGIFPKLNVGVVNYLQAENSANIKTVNGCEANFYGGECLKVVDVVALNGIVSELGNLVNSSGLEYNCNVLTNLTNAVWRIANQSDHSKFEIASSDETSVFWIENEHLFLPIDASRRYTLNELYNSYLANTIDEDKLNSTLLSKVKFTLQSKVKIFFQLVGRIRRERWDNLNIDNEGFLAVRVNKKFYLYKDTKRTLSDYELFNLGVVSPFLEYVNLTGGGKEFEPGDYEAEIFLVQYGENPFPTDIKYKQNLPRFRIDKSDPKLKFIVKQDVLGS